MDVNQTASYKERCARKGGEQTTLRKKERIPGGASVIGLCFGAPKCLGYEGRVMARQEAAGGGLRLGLGLGLMSSSYENNAELFCVTDGTTEFTCHLGVHHGRKTPMPKPSQKKINFFGNV